MGPADPAKDLTMTTDHDDTDFEPPRSSSPTDHFLNKLQLDCYRPFREEPHPRPLPEGNAVTGAVADIFDALVSTLNDTRLEPDLEDPLWSAVTYLTWTEHNLLRQVSYQGERQDKPARQVVRAVPHP